MLADTPSPRGSGATLAGVVHCPRASNGLLPRRSNLVGYVRWDERSDQSSFQTINSNSFTRSRPSGILGHHAEDQIPNLLGGRSAASLLRDPGNRPQYRRKPVRCQRTAVSGVTMRRDCFQADQTRRATTQKSLSKLPRLGRGWRRFRTESCCRKAKFSRRRLRCERKRRTIVPMKSLTNRNMAKSYTRMLARPQQLCY